eukprot:NODE_4032_length_717_cov_173.155589.p1 GENE.NODE_4032_length_717_cov_173.155589~~NODE_4032_length_717_cov_173.155589.p1  ORF type:complete len:190 (-),score=34.43 NODE_4032_length_717_cov_173.155589:130-699(-)
MGNAAKRTASPCGGGGHSGASIVSTTDGGGGVSLPLSSLRDASAYSLGGSPSSGSLRFPPTPLSKASAMGVLQDSPRLQQLELQEEQLAQQLPQKLKEVMQQQQQPQQEQPGHRLALDRRSHQQLASHWSDQPASMPMASMPTVGAAGQCRSDQELLELKQACMRLTRCHRNLAMESKLTPRPPPTPRV